jgi:RNA polymerase sigma-70 factor (ECF subfamily)
LKAPFTEREQEVRAVTDWDRIVREHGPLVYRVAWRILGHAADTEDVVQDVFLQAYQMNQAEPVRWWAALLRRLATCRALDRLRQRKACVPLDGLEVASGPDGPEAIALGHELAERLRRALASLTPREASVFCLRYFEDLSYQHIAETLGIPSGAVGTALHKARARLEALLLEPVPED